MSGRLMQESFLMTSGKGLISVIDYGVGNAASVCNAFERAGCLVDYSTEINSDARGVVLPGVGSFSYVSTLLHQTRLADQIENAIDRNMPLLGICLGMQLLCSSSEEGDGRGLGIFDSKVTSLKGQPSIRKVPHTGYTKLSIKRPGRLLDGISEKDARFYFVHSFGLLDDLRDEVCAVCPNTNVVAAIEKANVFGTQFHPEKSGAVGKKLIKNFVSVCHADSQNA